jgi:hypothetical protein
MRLKKCIQPSRPVAKEKGFLFALLFSYVEELAMWNQNARCPLHGKPLNIRIFFNIFVG